MKREDYVRWLDDLVSDDVDLVGGKNASLGEMPRNLKERGVRRVSQLEKRKTGCE